jgi:enamine deaminase RidA (YjgF/YER057c/UK114 family)
MFGAGCNTRRITHVPPTREGAPYSRAVWVGDTLYLAGDGAPHEDPVQEAHNVMRSVQATLVTQGLTLDDLVSVTVYCSDVSLYDTFNKVYRSYFKDKMPARAFVGSGDLLWDMRYEVQGIAVRR